MVMAPAIEFLFDFGSPNVYLAYRALPPVLERTGARLDITPCLLGGIFKATNNQSPIVAFAPVKGKVAYEMLEIRRFVARNRIDRFRLNPHFPVNTLMLMRGLVAAREAGLEAAFLEMGLKGMWEDGLKLDDPEVLKRTIDAARRRIRSNRSSPTIRPKPSSAACSAFRRSSSARRCSGARSGWGRSRRPFERRRRKDWRARRLVGGRPVRIRHRSSLFKGLGAKTCNFRARDRPRPDRARPPLHDAA
jgi:2-hydroxychromene-2-carboxylate isomerase